MRTTTWTGLLLVTLTACGSGGGSDGSAGDVATSRTTTSSALPTAYDDPVQLETDPCTLVTQQEAEEVIGAPVAMGKNGHVCTYTANGNGGHIAVEDLAPAFCTLLVEALQQDLFGGDQVRVDDVGDGAMLVKGNGDVQFTVEGGCIDVSGSLGDGSVSDEIMLDLARTAGGRVTG